MLFSLAASPSKSHTRPERAILFLIDGLHIDAPGKFEMPNFSQLAGQGTLVEKTTVIMPAHPTHGDYALVHSCSFPNPVLMAGSIFLKAGQKMLQHSFENTAFVANDMSYRTITDGYDFVIQKNGPDAFSVDQALNLFRHNDLDFMRVHLQNAGDAGYQTYTAPKDQPFRYNIWHEDGPYRQTVEEADRQLGKLVSELKALNKWEGALLVVAADHGQTETGWHPLLPEESWLHPTLFHGPGVKAGYTVERADQTDIAPTIADLMGVPAPNTDGGSGKVLHDIKLSSRESAVGSDSRLLELNRVFSRYQLAEARLRLHAVERPYLNSFAMILEREFYGLERITEWRAAGSVDSLIEHNLKIVLQMEEKLEKL